MGRIHGALTVVDISDSCEGKFDRISQVSLLQFMTCIRKIFFVLISFAFQTTIFYISICRDTTFFCTASRCIGLGLVITSADESMGCFDR